MGEPSGTPQARLSVDRAIGELRRGEPVLITGAGATPSLALAAEAATASGLARLRMLAEAKTVRLVMTAKRAHALGLGSALPDQANVICAIQLDSTIPARAVAAAIDPTVAPADLPSFPAAEPERMAAGSAAVMAIELAKLGALLPGTVTAIPAAEVPDPQAWAQARSVLLVDREDIVTYGERAAFSLRRVGEATVPLADAEDARLIAFRPQDGGLEHLAILIGDPPRHLPVLARVHSQCFTGDLLGSLRCDCGDQLRGAIAEIAKAGGGLVLYLPQEGRGIGLVNKLRAYALQDEGLDTIEANEALGFGDDERLYLSAAAMLQALGFERVRLLTNNPEKVEALRHCGVQVTERVPHIFPSNDHNARYLRTKAVRAGHLL